MLEMTFDENGLFYHSYKYGVTIVIPPGAVQQCDTLQFGVCLILPHFRSHNTFIPVSPFVWIHTDSVLSKPAELYIPHYVNISSDEDKKKLNLLSTKCFLSTKESDKLIFTVNTEAEDSITFSQTFAIIHMTHFCSTCVATKDINTSKRYHLLYAKKEFEDGNLQLDICIMYSFRCYQVIMTFILYLSFFYSLLNTTES